MKQRIIITALAAFIALFTAAPASAQFDQAADNIALMVITPTQADGLPSGAENALRNKMRQMISANGLGSMDFSQFCLLVNIDVMDKYIVGGAPVKHAQNLDFNFYIVDQFNETVFAHTSVSARGVGDNETKAFIESIKQLNVRNPELTAFINNGKQKIVDYYNANCDKIIEQAYLLASMKQFDEALFRLFQIPDACTECYARAVVAQASVWQMYVDEQCQINLAQAKTAWVSEQNATGARRAGQYLSQIYPDAACYNEAMGLYNEISNKIQADWNFVMKIYQDGVDLEKQRISAARDVGVAWGQNQQPITYSPAFIVR